MRTDSPGAAQQWVCNRKKSYPDPKMAARVARQRSAKIGVDLVVYGCRHCGQWHLGSRRADDVQGS
jgi:hypothetical protein